MSQLNNPHDKFFKETFSRLEIAQSFIEETFPPEIRERINLFKLKKTNASFTDADLSEHLADIVYQTEYAGQQALVSLLFEHKSYPEKYPHLQLLRYMNNVWLEEQKQNKQLSVVISTVIYHGEAVWKKLSMIAYFGNPHESLHQFIPQFDYLLFSLNEIQDYQIENFKNDLLSVTTMLMKHSRDKANNFLNLAPFLVDKLNALDAAHQDDFIKTTFRYIEGGINLTQNKLSPIFTQVSQNVNNIAMTIADEIREETTFNNIKSLLQNGASIELISKSFGISIQKVEEIIKKLKSSSN
ncbi:Rpn family recombination-promoting nuclease/putative transposase [Arcicella aquatica]|uniref:Rpn family recombination-promoting nuclease/putative transposase n=1 Tax=Arcicella aquatica TaxID=217141 RepID=A0ABU5QML3_9BACT|nr:Rpn family recombination-promoting nuclease/putative transposase [Arcicella aquatica]MEA5258311.1 Rpn family recombination-promoting nuclease/putative transposase [Arcicella aquatica]